MPSPMLFLLLDAGLPSWRWDGVAAALGDRFEVVVLDAQDAEQVADAIRRRAPDAWLIAGAGAGARVAAVVTAWGEGAEHGLIPPASLLLVGSAATEDDLAGVRRTPTTRLDDEHDLVDRIDAVWAEARDHQALPAAFARLIASDRVAARTRRAMMRRLDPPGDAPRALSAAQRELLSAVLARVLPQRGTDLDLADRIDVGLAAGPGDGWRYAELPPDAEAWRRGLDTIAAVVPGFADLPAAEQDAVIDRIADGGIGSEAQGLLTGRQMALWCTDLQAEAVRAWLSHPAAQAWIRYDGFADGGDGPDKEGFRTTHAGEWEPWQRDWRTGEELRA